MKNEIWKSVIGYEGLYEISNDGILRSCRKKVGTRILPAQIMKYQKDRKGYFYVSLYKDKKYRKWKIHRLVALAFLDNPENKPQIDHINGNKIDNRVENLRWVSGKENCNNPNTKGKLSTPVVQLYNGRIVERFKSITEASAITEIPVQYIIDNLKGRREETYGYKWEYL